MPYEKGNHCIFKVKSGPEYVCTCCHRLMYRKTVTVLNVNKYTKVNMDTLNTVFASQYRYVSIDNKLWICSTCECSLKRGIFLSNQKQITCHCL